MRRDVEAGQTTKPRAEDEKASDKIRLAFDFASTSTSVAVSKAGGRLIKLEAVELALEQSLAHGTDASLLYGIADSESSRAPQRLILPVAVHGRGRRLRSRAGE